jgi:SAM-dependent methyltransferase
MNAYHAKAYQNEGLIDLIEQIPPTEKRVLDVGCGAGDNAKLLGKLKHELHGVTLSQSEAALAKPHFHSVVVADVETWAIPFEKEYFDAILFSHVVEHLVDPQATLVRLKQVLRTGGHLYLAAPNVLFWRQRFEFLMGKFEYLDEGILDRTHLRFFTHKSLGVLIEKAGFQIVQHRAVGHFPVGKLRRLAPRFFAAIDRLLCRMAPGLFGFHLLIIAKKI